MCYSLSAVARDFLVLLATLLFYCPEVLVIAFSVLPWLEAAVSNCCLAVQRLATCYFGWTDFLLFAVVERLS